MINWERKKYLARGCFIQEEACFKGAQRIVLEFVIKNAKPCPRAFYYIGDRRMKGFELTAHDVITARDEAFKKVHEWIEEEASTWNTRLLQMWQSQNWEDA